MQYQGGTNSDLTSCFWGHVILSQHVSTPRPTRRLAQAFQPVDSHPQFRRQNIAARGALHQHAVLLPCACGGVLGGGWSGVLVGVGAHWFALLASLHCLPAWFAALCLLSVVSALAGFIHLLVKGTLFWFVCCASRGHRFALGTGGLKQSLLVGGIGPVYSLPKLCFNPFRRLSAVGFVLGWHREPHLITTLQAPFSIGYCRTHGGNHRGWTSCGDR